MTSDPLIKAISATKDETSTLIMALLDNNIRGMVQIRAYLDASCGTEDSEMRDERCIPKTSNIYIPQLYWLLNAYKEAPTQAAIACLRTYVCDAGEDCDTHACSNWKSFETKTDIPIKNVFGTTPIAVSNLTLTPGNGKISVSWGDVDQPTTIWAHTVRLFEGTDTSTTELVAGWVLKNNILISNLKNGTPYTVSVKAGSFDGFPGPWTEQTATPIAPTCTIPECKITIATG